MGLKEGKPTGMALQVPILETSWSTSLSRSGSDHLKEICAEMKRRSGGDTKGFLRYADEASASTDSNTNPTSFSFDSKAGITLDPIFVKVVGWYNTSGSTLAVQWT